MSFLPKSLHRRVAGVLLALAAVCLLGAAVVQVYQSPIVVPTLADMQRLEPHPRLGTVRVLGRLTPKDWGGPRDYLVLQTNLLLTNDVQQVASKNTNWAFVHAWSGDPMLFGADGSGVNDSTSAISNACALAQIYAVDLVLPAGTFKVDSTDGPVFWVRTNGFTIRGAGKDLTRIVDVGTGTVVQVGEDSQFHQRNIIRDFGIAGTNSAALVKTAVWACYNVLQNLYLQGGAKAIDADNWSWGFDVEDVDVFNATTGIYHGYTNPHWNYRGVKVRYCHTGLFFTNRVAAFYVDDQTWTGGNISHNTNGVVAYGARWIRFNDVYFEENGSSDSQEATVQLNSLARGFVFKNPRFVNQRGSGFSVAGIGHEIYNASFTTIPSNRYGIHVTSGASNTRIVTDADGPWAKGSGASITAASGGTATNNALQQSDLTLANGGSGYSANAKVYIIGGNGRGATATLGISDAGVITNVTLVQGGTGYTGAPTISVHDWDTYLFDQGNKSQVNGMTVDTAAAIGESPTIIQQSGFVLNNADKTLWYVDRSGNAERVGGRPWYRYDGSDQYGWIRGYSQDGTTRWGSIGFSQDQVNLQPGSTSADAWQLTTFGWQPAVDNTEVMGTASRRILASDISTITAHNRLLLRTNTSVSTPPDGYVALAGNTNGSGGHEVRAYFPDGSSIALGGGGGGGGTGSVTSVGLALPASLFHVSGSPVTTTGTLTGALTNQAANRVFAGPSSGGDAAPAFRLLVLDDMPSGVATDAEVNARISDDAYDATAWNNDTNAPTKNAIRDKIESMGGGGGSSTNLLVNGHLVTEANLEDGPNIKFQVVGSTITPILTNAPGTVTSNVLQRTGGATFQIADTGMAYELTNVVYEGCVTNLNMVGGYSDATGYFQVLMAARSNANYHVVLEVPGNTYPMAGNGGYLGLVVEETQTATGFEFVAFATDGLLSCPIGTGGRISIYETVTVGGSGEGGGGANIAANWYARTEASGDDVVILPPVVDTVTTNAWAPDFSAGKVLRVVMNGNLTISAPAGVTEDMIGQTFLLQLVQDGTGGRAIASVDSVFKFGREITAIGISTNANSRSYVPVVVVATNEFDVAGSLTGYAP